MTVWYLRWGVVGMLVIVAGSLWLAPQTASHLSTSPYLAVSFLDVGQGDAVFIETPDGVQVLIDGGPDASVVRELAQRLPPWDRTIDIVVATHADKDHVAGLIEVLERYQVNTIIMTENAHSTEVADVYRRMVEAEGAEIVFARAGQIWQLGSSTTVQVYSPAGDPTEWESNASSVVARLLFGETAFLLTGDAPLATEEFLVRQFGHQLQSTVLKLGHHGSRTSTSELFARTVAPDYAVVSAGKGNRYGHPHPDPITNVSRAGALVLSTAERGTITFMSDGQTVWLE